MVKILSRDSINRMVGRKSSVAGVGGGGGDVDLSGYATKIWTQETFVSIDFFRSLFRAYDSQNHEILPNDTTSTIDNIKAMFGFWTEQYLSALGQGSGGGGGGASALSDLLDVQLTNPTNGQALIYNSTLGKWVNGSAGTDMASVWENLAGATTEQINVSHLTNALSGYVTTSAISDMATQTWVGQQGYATQTWVNDNYLSIAFFNRLFQAYAGTGSSAIRVNPNDTTSTIDNVKAMFGFWTEQYISALGQGTGGGGGGVGDVTWDLLADNSDTRQIALSHLTTALSGYALTSQLPTKVSQLTNDSGYITSSALSGYALTSQIPTNNNQLTNGAGYITSAAISDMATQTWANGQFLKLSGGTMTGAITMKANQYTGNYAIDMNNSDIVNANSIYTSDLSDSWDEGIEFKRTNGYYDSFRAADGTFYFGVNSGTEKDGANLGSASANLGYVYTNHIHPGNNNNLWLNANSTTHIIANGPLIIPTSNDMALSSYGRYALAIGGDPRNNEAHIGIDNNEIMAKGSASTTATLYLNAEGGTVCINETAGNCGIGTGSPSYKLHVSGTFYASGNAFVGDNLIVNGGDLTINEPNSSGASAIWFQSGGTTYGNLRVKPSNGEFYFYQGTANDGQSSVWVNAGGFYAYGQVVSLSDERDKNVVGDVSLNVEQIANAPAIRFTWEDGRDDKSMQAGSIAQYWHKVLPEVIREKDDRLSLNYGVAALVSSIITARKVVDHERRIAELERENKELKMKLKIA